MSWNCSPSSRSRFQIKRNRKKEKHRHLLVVEMEEPREDILCDVVWMESHERYALDIHSE